MVHWHVKKTYFEFTQLKTRIDDCADAFIKHIRETNGEPFDVKK